MAGVKGHGGTKPSVGTRTNRARATQYQSPSTGSSRSGGSNGPLKASKGSPSTNLKGANAQQRDPDVDGAYQRGNRVGSGGRTAGVKKASVRTNRS